MDDPRSAAATPERRLAAHAVALVWFAAVCVSTAALFVRHSTAPSLVLAAYRKLFAALLLLPAVLFSREGRRELRAVTRETALWCLLGGVFLALHFWTYFLSVNYTTVSASQTLIGAEVLFVASFMFLTGQERFNAWSRAGIFLALAGSLTVAYAPGGLRAGGGALFGNLCGLFSALMLALYSLVGVKVRRSMGNTVYNLLIYGVAAAVLCAMVGVSPYSLTGYGAVNYLTAFLMAVFNSLLGHSIFNWSFKYLSPTLVSVIKLFQPVLATAWAFLLLSELPTANQLVGCAMLTAGIFIYIRHKDAGRRPQ